MTEFGDLDMSILPDSPPGRQPVHTYLGEEAQRDKWWEFFRRKLREGRQGYVITPIVEQHDDLIKAKKALLKVLKNLEDQMTTQFRETMTALNAYFKEIFAELFNGGQAELVIENEEDVIAYILSLKDRN